MKKLLLALICACVLGPALTDAADPDFAAWKWKRSIDPRETAGFVKIPVSSEIFNDSQKGLQDLRVINDTNEPIPHLLRWNDSGNRTEWKPAKLLNSSRIDKKYSRVVADFGRTEEKNTIQVNTSGTNFRRRVEVEGSNDSVVWEKLSGAFLLFDVTTKGQQQRLDTLTLPLNNFRFLKLTVYNMPDDSAPITIAAVKCASRKVIPENHLIAVSTGGLSITQDKERKETVIRIDLGFKNLPINRIRIQTNDPFFYRGFSLSAGNDAKTDGKDRRETFETRAVEQTEPIRYLCSGVFYRIRDREGSHESLVIEDIYIPYRYLELRIHNEDNPPLNVTSVGLWRGAADLIFEARSGRSYSLLGGNQNAHAPNYDLSSSIRDLDKDTLPIAEIGPSAKGPEKKIPWTERHGTLILLILIVLAGGVGFFIFRSMKNLPKEK
jgi:hypothetical protein